MEIGKIPPQAIEIETVLIGALMIEPGQIDVVKTMLPKEAFYKEAHQWIYAAMVHIQKKNGKVDILTVTEKLRSMEKLEAVGGASYVAGLSSRVGSALNVKYHAAIVYEKYVGREIIRIGSALVEKAFDEGTEPLDAINEFMKAMETRKLHFLGLTTTGVSVVEAANQSIEDYFTRVNNRNNGIITGLPSTFKKLNSITGGFQPGQLIVLAGRPGMGKTSVAIAELITAAKAGKKCFMFSLEMTSARLMDKVICSLGDLDHSQYKRGTMSHDDAQKAEDCLAEIETWDMTFNENMLTDIDQIHATAKAKQDRDGLDFVCIDYLQLMRSRGKHGNREQEVANISRGAKMMAVDLGVPVLLLAQLNRGVEARGDKRPMLSDLRESGAIEQDADIVIFVYRESLYDDMAPTDTGELIIDKHREGPTGTVDFKTNESLTRFTDDDEPFGAFTPPVPITNEDIKPRKDFE
jgi:replicative DNA helicase